MRALAEHMDKHFAGLSMAARAAQRAKKLKQVDDAFNVLRHITAPSATGLLQELNICLIKDKAADVEPNTDAELSSDDDAVALMMQGGDVDLVLLLGMRGRFRI